MLSRDRTWRDPSLQFSRSIASCFLHHASCLCEGRQTLLRHHRPNSSSNCNQVIDQPVLFLPEPLHLFVPVDLLDLLDLCQLLIIVDKHISIGTLETRPGRRCHRVLISAIILDELEVFLHAHHFPIVVIGNPENCIALGNDAYLLEDIATMESPLSLWNGLDLQCASEDVHNDLIFDLCTVFVISLCF